MSSIRGGPVAIFLKLAGEPYGPGLGGATWRVGLEEVAAGVATRALTGHEGCSYESPPQPRDQALTLARVLLGYTGDELNGDERWRCPIAGGRRTVRLERAS